MRFNCAPAAEERARLRMQRLSNWHFHFALIPRRLGANTCVWLETIWRKGTQYEDRYFDGYDFYTYLRWRWEYRAAP